MRECGKYVKMRDFPHGCGMVDTYVLYNSPERVILNAVFTMKNVLLGSDARKAGFRTPQYADHFA